MDNLFNVTKPIIVIDGYDGCGKTTQVNLLKERVNWDKCRIAEFPNRDSGIGRIINMCLNNKLTAKSMDMSRFEFVDFMATLFAHNRLEYFVSKYDGDYSYIFGRYSTSNMLYSSASIYEIFKDMSSVELYLNAIMAVEHEYLSVPLADHVIYLDMPESVALANIESRGNRKELYESKRYVKSFIKVKEYLIERFKWHRIYCTDEKGEMYSIEEIYNRIYKVFEDENLIDYIF